MCQGYRVLPDRLDAPSPYQLGTGVNFDQNPECQEQVAELREEIAQLRAELQAGEDVAQTPRHSIH